MQDFGLSWADFSLNQESGPNLKFLGLGQKLDCCPWISLNHNLMGEGGQNFVTLYIKFFQFSHKIYNQKGKGSKCPFLLSQNKRMTHYNSFMKI